MLLLTLIFQLRYFKRGQKNINAKVVTISNYSETAQDSRGSQLLPWFSWYFLIHVYLPKSKHSFQKLNKEVPEILTLAGFSSWLPRVNKSYKAKVDYCIVHSLGIYKILNNLYFAKSLTRNLQSVREKS